MKIISKTRRTQNIFRFAISLTAVAAILAAMVSLPLDTGKAAPGAPETVKELYKRPAPNFDLKFAERPPGNIRAARRSRQL